MLSKLNSGPATDIFIFDPVNKNLINVGGFKEESLKSTVEAFNEILQGGEPKQLAGNLQGEAELLESAVGSNASSLDGIVGMGCHIWLLAGKETFVVHDANFTIGYETKHSPKAANALKLKFSVVKEKISDSVYRMPGNFDPTDLVLLLHPSLQKNSTETKILDFSNYKRTGVWSGMTTGAWAADKKSLAFDGVNDYISFADSEFRGSEMIGGVDSNNRIFETGIGNWTKQNANDTLTSAANGATGNGGRLLVGSSATVNLLKLSSDVVNNLTVGRSYHLEMAVRYDTSWTGGLLVVSIGGCNEGIYLTDTYQTLSFDFIANSVDSEIVVTSLVAPTSGDILRLDSVSLSESSKANLNLGERIFAQLNRGFEQTGTPVYGNWSASGNHSFTILQGRGGAGTSALGIQTSGAGSQSTNYGSLPSANIYPIVSGKQYTLEFWAKIGTAGITVTAGFGASGQTKNFTGLSTGSYTKCVFNFLAGTNDVSQSLRLWLSATDSTGTAIDDVSITEALDATIFMWLKRDTLISGYKYFIHKRTTRGFICYGSDSQNQINIFTDDTTAATAVGSAILPRNKYCLVVCSIKRSGSMFNYYDDGNENGSVSVLSIGKMFDTSALEIGRQSTDYLLANIGSVGLKVGTAWSQLQVKEFFKSTRGIYDV